jgi:hypothetical protein
MKSEKHPHTPLSSNKPLKTEGSPLKSTQSPLRRSKRSSPSNKQSHTHISSPPPQDQEVKHVIFVIHGMGKPAIDAFDGNCNNINTQ